MESLALEMLSCFPYRVAQVQFDYFANTTSVAMIDNVPVTQAGTRNFVSYSVCSRDFQKAVISSGFL